MSSDSFAALRKGLGPELGALAEEHMKHDPSLQQSDRDALRSAASTLSTHVSIGSVLGLSLAVFAAYRLRSARRAMFNTFRASEQPTAVKFANGREEVLPDLTKVMRPSTLGDVATYTLLGFGGLFLGGETGVLTGTLSARRTIGADRESRERIEKAFKRFRADVLRKQADALDQQQGSWL
ncbi:hypothetical protein BDY17DRAFT_40397 [Neohortaea acidophila]|uniref:Altered inheritance of mitochondria protein 11 n=1 Tax=Neohortaea acidophila TaxID=245834 RepID=A0A6A6PI96_9PEZI|nr:uncharacterized protein BDY17DRAFT_40397 [Neohortaea acidophila]KAF2479516.1 hypothetical protein BDY17DRAFT_40397 [Neohortaea acidophila]